MPIGRNCTICSHSHRAEIETAILNMSSDASLNTLEQIADDFELSLVELQSHAMFHTPLGLPVDPFSTSGYSSALPEAASDTVAEAPEVRNCLTRSLKLREADMLEVVNNEYMSTLTSLGRRINSLTRVSPEEVEDSDGQVRLARSLTKPMVDLYLGVGGEIRQNIKAMSELNRALNGPEDSGSAGLTALANAITQSAQNSQ